MPDGRFSPLDAEFGKLNVLHIDTQAPLPDLLQCTEQRLRLARNLLASLEGADACDLRPVAEAAQLLLEDACGVLGQVDKALGRWVG